MKETTTKKRVTCLTQVTQRAVQITFVDEDKITAARSASSTSATGEIDEYDTHTYPDSGTDFNEVSEGPAVSCAFTTISGRVLRAYHRLDI